MARLAMRRAGSALNASLTIIVLTPLTTFSAERSGMRQLSICFCWGIFIVMAGPARGRSRRARLFRAALPCLALIALTGTAAQAQTVTSDLFSPTRAQPGDVSRIRRCAARRQRRTIRSTVRSCRTATRTSPRRRGSARSRHTACLPRAAPRRPVTTRSTASAQNPNSIRASPGRNAIGPGNPAAPVTSPAGPTARAAIRAAVADRQQDAAAARDGRHGGRAAAAQAAEDR